jgi:DNA ligase-1
VLLRELVQTSEAVAATSGRTAKITEIAGLLRRAGPGEVPVVVAFLSGELRQRQIGVGYASLGELLRLGAVPGGAATGGAVTGEGPLTVAETDAVFEKRSHFSDREIGKEGEQGSIAKRWLRRTRKKC